MRKELSIQKFIKTNLAIYQDQSSTLSFSDEFKYSEFTKIYQDQSSTLSFSNEFRYSDSLHTGAHITLNLVDSEFSLAHIEQKTSILAFKRGRCALSCANPKANSEEQRVFSIRCLLYYLAVFCDHLDI